jgi:hypothetical protein
MALSVRLSMLSIAAALLAAPASALAADPGCGAVVTEDVVLESDLVGCPEDGLVVAAAGVTVDLNDHLVSGTGLGAGIRVQAPDATVRRGTITGFDRGVSVVVDEVGTARLRQLEVASNGRGVVLGSGFGATGPGSLTLAHARVHDNAGAGVAASGWRFETVIRESRIRGNGGAGIIFNNDSFGGTVTDSWVAGNRTGVVYDFAPGGRVVGNLISGNGVWGLFGFRSGGMTVTGNAITGNGTPGELSGGAYTSEGGTRFERNLFAFNTGDGLLVEEHEDHRPLWPIRDNVAIANSGWGINAQPGFANSGNVARRNGQKAQCLNVVCRRG